MVVALRRELATCQVELLAASVAKRMVHADRMDTVMPDSKSLISRC